MAYRQTPLTFGFITDTHFSVIRNGFRTDSYYDSVLSKFRQCYDYFNSNGAAFIVHGGDMFDKYRSYSHQMLLDIRETITSSCVPTYFIWGQHDLLGYNRESAKGSNLAFLKEICDGKLIEVTDRLELPNAHLIASHVDQDPLEVLKGVSTRLRKPAVAIVHALLYDRESSFGTVDIRKFGKVGVDVVLSGDLHCGFAPVELDGTVYCNPGSLARTSREERLPKCLLVHVEPFMGRWTVRFDEFFPDCERFPFPDEREEVKVPDEQDSSEYMESFEKFRTGTKDIFERLEKVGEEHGIDKEILAYIKSKHGDE